MWYPIAFLGQALTHLPHCIQSGWLNIFPLYLYGTIPKEHFFSHTLHDTQSADTCRTFLLFLDLNITEAIVPMGQKWHQAL